MNSLRWILLLLGVLFIAGLAWRELRRQRQAGGSSERRSEPQLDLHDMPPPTERAVRAVEAGRNPPVIEWPVPGADDVDPADGGDADIQSVPIAVRTEPAAPGAVPAPGESGTRALVVDWPPENIRRICAIRLVPVGQERLPGRALRQSLQACGFRHGEFGIYHLGGNDDRVVVSAANLARPGMLDPRNMDYQRFGGLNLFTVLPAAMPDADALDTLIGVSRRLAERLHAQLQDEAGTPLDAPHLAALRHRYLEAGTNAGS
jgi:FtsZ-interacting cell division protein ZipA